jgi:hypothetical protein
MPASDRAGAAYRNGDFSAALNNCVIGTIPAAMSVLERDLTQNHDHRWPHFTRLRESHSRRLIDPVAAKVRPDTGDNEDNLIQNCSVTTTTPDSRVCWASRSIATSTPATAPFYYSKQSTDQKIMNDGLPDLITAVRVQAIYNTRHSQLRLEVNPTDRAHGCGLSSVPRPTVRAACWTMTPGGNRFPRLCHHSSGFPRSRAELACLRRNGLRRPTNANAYYDSKWTSVASATYIRGNHTFKPGRVSAGFLD